MRTLLAVVALLVGCATEEPKPARVMCVQQQWGNLGIALCDPECTVEPELDAVPCSYINQEGREVTQAGSFVTEDGRRGYCAIVRADEPKFRPYEVAFYECD
jgi:hypothetical protein